MKNQIRIAHLTDIHVASSWDVWKTALTQVGAGLLLAAPVVTIIETIVRQFEETSKKSIRIALYGFASAVAGLGVAVHPTLRRRLLFLRDIALLINQSSEINRKALFKSLHDEKVEHLFITGDISTSSRSAEFAQFTEELVKHGWDNDRVTVLPGNHDRLGFEGFSTFENYFPIKTTPIIRELIPGVILVGLDSTLTPSTMSRWERIWDDVFTNLQGNISNANINAIQHEFGGISDETIILGLHHPVIDMRPKTSRIKKKLQVSFRAPANSERLIDTMSSTNHLILCGHDHPTEPRYIEENGLKISMGMASGLVISHKKRMKHLNYSMLDVAPKGKIKIKNMTIEVK